MIQALLGGLSLFIHKSFRRSETLFCKQRRMRFIIVLINLFGNAYRCSNLTFIWSQLIPTMGEPKSSLMLAKILGSLKWVTAWTMASALFSGLLLLTMKENLEYCLYYTLLGSGCERPKHQTLLLTMVSYCKK